MKSLHDYYLMVTISYTASCDVMLCVGTISSVAWWLGGRSFRAPPRPPWGVGGVVPYGHEDSWQAARRPEQDRSCHSFLRGNNSSSNNNNNNKKNHLYSFRTAANINKLLYLFILLSSQENYYFLIYVPHPIWLSLFLHQNPLQPGETTKRPLWCCVARG